MTSSKVKSGQKRALLYARVSYDDRKNEARNLQGQVEDGRAYCQEKAYRIIAELAEDDRGASGADWDLPMLNRALDMARAKEFDVLVVRELDRFARGLAKQLVIEGEFRRAGVEIEYIIGEYPDTPEGNLNKNIKAVIAEYERLKTAERTRRARRNAVRNGRVMLHGNRPPYGYALEDGELVICEEQARTVRLIYTWYVTGGLSIRAIALKLSGMRVPTYLDLHKDQGGYKKRGYGEWSPDTVSDILGNETYAGTWHYGKRSNPRRDWLPVEVPAIISREAWKKAQERKRRNREMSKRNTKHEYLLARRVTCGQCGYKMHARTTKGHIGYYTCPTVDAARWGQPCDHPYFSTAQVDKAVWEWLRSLEPEILRERLKEQQAEQEQANKSLRDRLAVLDDLLADNRRQLEKLLDLYLSGDFDKEVLTERKARLETTVASLERERADLVATLEAQTLTDEQLEEIVKIFTMLDLAAGDFAFEARRRIVDSLDVQVTLAVEGGQKVAHVRCRVGQESLSIESPASRTAP